MRMPNWWKQEDWVVLGITTFLFAFVSWLEAGAEGFFAGVMRVLHEPLWLLLVIVCLMYRVIAKTWFLP